MKTQTQTQSMEQDKPQHSPLPWRFNDHWTQRNGFQNPTISCEETDEPFVAEILGAKRPWQVKEANARLIVRSVNNAEALAEALRQLINAYMTIPDKQVGCNIAHRYDKARAALAQWKASQ